MSAYEILKAIAHKVAAGESITFAKDWGLGSGTLVLKDGSHTHFGADIEDDEKKAVDDFIKGLNDLLVHGTGLSFCPPPEGVEVDHLPRETGDGTDTARGLAGYIASIYHLDEEAEDRIHSRIYRYGLDSAAAEDRRDQRIVKLQAERDHLIDREGTLHRIRAEAEDRSDKAEARVLELEADRLQFYRADGTVETLGSPQEVTERRVECAKRIMELELVLQKIRSDHDLWTGRAGMTGELRSEINRLIE